jgi:hypothetical protein
MNGLTGGHRELCEVDVGVMPEIGEAMSSV